MQSETRSIVSRSVRTVVASAILVLLVHGTAGARSRHLSTGLRPIAFGRVAPNFVLDRALGDERPTLAGLRGRPVVVNFWAAYCEPCRAELAAFARLRTEYGDRVRLVTVSDERPDVVAATLLAEHVEAIAVSDPDRKVFDLYGVSAIPVTLVLAADQTVRYVSIGELDWDELHAAIEAAASVSPSPST